MKGGKALYKTTITQSIAPTTMLAVKVNNLDPDLVTPGVAPEEPLVEVPVVPVAVELEVDERVPVPVDVTEAVAVCGDIINWLPASYKKEKHTAYKSELLYVVQELVAGITGATPGGFWLSPSQTKNSLGVYDAGILKAQPCVS